MHVLLSLRHCAEGLHVSTVLCVQSVSAVSLTEFNMMHVGAGDFKKQLRLSVLLQGITDLDHPAVASVIIAEEVFFWLTFRLTTPF